MVKFDMDVYLNKALKELDDRLCEMKVYPIELNVVGGFALLLHGIRMHKDQQTDIDYVGNAMPKAVKEVIDEVGIRYRLGRDWINCDVVMSGLDLDDFEYATGELHFEKAFELNVITVNVLAKEDILRMKVIAIDTSYMAWKDGGDFTRYKDFADVKVLMKDLGWDIKQLRLNTDYYVMEPYIYKMIEKFNSEQNNDIHEILGIEE